MKTNMLLRISLLAVLACIFVGCKCSSGDAGKEAGDAPEARTEERVYGVAMSLESTEEHPVFVDIDWSQYVYKVQFYGERIDDYATFVRIDEEASGKKFEDILGMYDVIAVPWEGRKLLLHVMDSGESLTEGDQYSWYVLGKRYEPDSRYDFDWGPFMKYAE